MTAFAVAQRTLFADPNRAVDGVLTATGGSTPCRVILGRVDEETLQSFDGPGRRDPGKVADVLVEQIPTRPVEGNTLTVGSVTYPIRTVDQRNDPDGLRWRLELGPQ